MDTSEDTQEYWEELETEIGGKVIWFSIGEFLEPFDGFAKHTVGMFFLTDTSLFFQTFPRHDFLRTLTNSFRKKKKGGEKVQREYPRELIHEVRIDSGRGLARMPSFNMPKFTMHIQGKEEMRFNLLDKKRGAELLDLLTGEGGGTGI